ncbi:MAG: gliding motility-associated C-terminal domain-containing protein, partial [Bacteroidia bacterium]
GEVVTPTFSTFSYILTQGFQQPAASLVALTATVSSTNPGCSGASDGTARIVVLGGIPPYNCNWSNGATTSQISQLAAGTYYITVTDAIGLTYSDSVVVDAGTGICDLQFYSGITPNGDGNNDFWIIDNIEDYQPNTVSILNRWGGTVWSIENYNNNDRRWDGNDKQGNVLPAGTYFYLVEVNGQTTKGWVEITR